MNSPCFSLRQYRDRDQDRQNRNDAELEAAREADSFSFGPRLKLFNPRGEAAMNYKRVCFECAQGNASAVPAPSSGFGNSNPCPMCKVPTPDLHGFWYDIKVPAECKCDLRTKLVGDGCAVCNPKLAEELSGQSGVSSDSQQAK